MSNEEIICLAMENKYYLEQSMIVGEVMFGLLLVLLLEIALMVRNVI
jgi:hypothetical protein